MWIWALYLLVSKCLEIQYTYTIQKETQFTMKIYFFKITIYFYLFDSSTLHFFNIASWLAKGAGPLFLEAQG